MTLDPKIWGPPYWFFLHTLALTYPKTPNEVIKKKYYDFVLNIPLFLPVPEIGNTFSILLDKYPVTPYLDSQPSFVKWMHFIHNKINEMLKLPELTMEEAMVKYYEHYKPKTVARKEHQKTREKYIYIIMICVVISAGVYIYRS